MSRDLFVVFTTLALYAAAVVSPGPSFALISRLAVGSGRRVAIGAALGLAFGATFYAGLTMTGMALMLSRIGWLATAIRIAGGLYLIYLGLSAWFGGKPEAFARHPRAKSAWSGPRMGLIVELSNPKGIAFYLGLYAAAVPLDTAAWAKGVILAGGFSMEVLWYSFVAVVLSSPPVHALYRRWSRWIERLIGTALAGLGLHLLSEHV